MTADFKDKVAVVTGGGSGIGRALCRAFASEGYHLIVADVNLDGAQHTLAMLEDSPGQAMAVHLDVGSAESWKELHQAVMSAHGRCDVLCNNAGIARYGAFLDSDFADWEAQARVNVLGVMLGCKTMLPMMIEQASGCIVNTSSLAGLHPWPEGSFYTASKYASVGFSETLREELAGTGVHIAILCPGGVDTPMNEGLDTSGERLASPEEVAQLVMQGIRERRDWIFTHDEYFPMLEERHRAIVADHEPLRQKEEVGA